MKTLSRRGQVILGIAAVILLTALSLVAVGVVDNLVNPGAVVFCPAPGVRLRIFPGRSSAFH
ncbi:hypothetical protein [Pseudarthrobacter sp. S6]|uniref:hypothetical protein n=1 Tax=Pseudarthrobacter sp. S6 TaxID=3418420 RepID=UPI003CE741D1